MIFDDILVVAYVLFNADLNKVRTVLNDDSGEDKIKVYLLIMLIEVLRIKNN